MNRRELLKLFMASTLPLGGLLEKLGESVTCKVGKWDVSFSERPDRRYCIQAHARIEVNGKPHHFACLFDKDDKFEDIKRIFSEHLGEVRKRIQRYA